MQAIKPGNVGFHAAAEDLSADDFIKSAEVSAGPITEPSLGLGERIYKAVYATHQAVGTNTNLGIVLLVAILRIYLRNPL